jgi:hypothetical protein
MFFNKDNNETTIEQVINKHDLSLQELLIRIDVLDREVKTLLDELQVTPEQVSKFISDSSNFTPENWEELQQQRQSLELKLSREKENIRDPLKNKKTFSERASVQQHWLYVK